MFRVRIRTVILLLFWAPCGLCAGAGGGKRSMPAYEGPYYIIYSELPPQRVREAELRMTRMAEAYHERTKDFSGAIQQKLPFYLFTNEQDYLDAGGLENSAGIFDRSSQVMMAVAGETPSVETWHVIQHEGFHQFAAAVIGGELPIWVNEGLAEYFGEGIFTGDGFVTGIVPDWRLRRIRMELQAQRFRSLEEMMKLDHSEWNNNMSVANYDQAWSMVHFLAHADNGKYQRAFVGYMQDLGRRAPADKAWEENFGSASGFEDKWRDYWQNLPAGATADAYARATVQTLTGAMARAYVKKQTFDSLESLTKAITSGTLKFDPQDWLPASVFDVALENLSQLQKRGHRFWITSSAGRQPTMLCELADGVRWTGQFVIRSNRVAQVNVSKGK